MQGRLNNVQLAMLQWNDWHAYNAVHVARFSSELDLARLRTCVNRVLESRGLGLLNLDRETGRFQYEKAAADCPIEIIEPGPDIRLALHQEVERQTNMRFATATPFWPFRFFVLPGQSEFFLSLSYFHAAADADAVALLIRDLASSYLNVAVEDDSRAVELYPQPHNYLIWQRPALFLKWLINLPGWVWTLLHSNRPQYHNTNDFRIGFEFLTFEPAELTALKSAAREAAVTVNDFMLALLMQSLSPLAEARFTERRRTRISLGVIVNTRRAWGAESGSAFGLFLGSFLVAHESPPDLSSTELARALARQTSRIKRNQLFLAAPQQLALARWVIGFCSTNRQKKFYQKHYPLWGGITNINLDSKPNQPATGWPVDYFRAVSTGPVSPLVLSATTSCGRMNITLTYRTTVFTAAQVAGIKERLLAGVDELKASVRAAC